MQKYRSDVPVTFNRPWTILRPPLYRYLAKKYVDEFFETGRLRLSSFSEFKKHPDEERRDAEEGINHIYQQNREAGLGIGVVMLHGENTYVWCSCMQLDPERMAKWGGSYIQVNDSIGFANAVSSHILGFQQGAEGPCIYLNQRLLTGDLGAIKRSDVETDGKPDAAKMMALSQAAAGPDVYFTKLRKHSGDQEYRFVWLSSKPTESELYINCPEAREFCSPPQTL